MNTETIMSVFNYAGTLFLSLNCIQLVKDRSVKGVSLIATTFFVIWSWWNVIYFYKLPDMPSFYSSIPYAIVNTIWISLAIYYHRLNKINT
jgi:hypothetical protein